MDRPAHERFVALDTETHLIGPGQVAPPMVCLSHATHERSGVIHRRDPACRAYLDTVFGMALRGWKTLVGQNIAYDFGVIANEWPDLLPTIFRLYDEDRVTDTSLRQKLIDIAEGTRTKATKYNLEVLAKRHEYPVALDKDTWRLRYKELDDVPCRDWPREALDYPEHDALSTLWVAVAQDAGARWLEDEFRQARAAWALHLVSAWGIRTDRIMVARQRREVEEKLRKYDAMLREEGLVFTNKKGAVQRRVKVAQERALRLWQGDVPAEFQTEGGEPALTEDAVTALGDDVLVGFQALSSSSTALDRVKELEGGVEVPIHTRFDSLVNTGRTSSSGPNIQNRPVEPGDRECFVPRRGHVFIDADFDGNELRSVSQVMIHAGMRPRLADVLNAGGDPHCMVASTLLGCSYEDALRRKDDPNDEEMYLARQSGKIANFGLSGGLGWNSLRVQARAKYGVKMTEDESRALVAGWRETWPEFPEYFRWINAQTAPGTGTALHFGSRRYRGDIPYTVMCNTFFQGLAADETKAALYALVRECYVGRGVLRGSRVVNFIHDQYIAEIPESDQYEEFVADYQRILTEEANKWLPDVPTRAKPVVCRRWSKKVKTVKDDRGRIVPWEWDKAIEAGSPGHAE